MLTLSGFFQGFSGLQRLKTATAVNPRPARVLRTVHPMGAKIQVGPVADGPVRTRGPAALRVVRVCDAQPTPGDTGRMRISGRMADVCAELERLAAREAATARH